MAPELLVAASLAFGAAPDKPVQPGLRLEVFHLPRGTLGTIGFWAGTRILVKIDFGFSVSSIDWLNYWLLQAVVCQFGVLPLHLRCLELILKGVCSLQCQ